MNIIDGKNKIRLKSSRDEVIGDIKIRKPLMNEMLLDYISWLIFQASICSEYPQLLNPFGAKTWKIDNNGGKEGIGDAVNKISDYLICREGILPNTGWHIANSGFKLISCIINNGDYKDIANSDLSKVFLSPVPVFFEEFNIYGGFNENLETVFNRYVSSPVNSRLYSTHSWTLLCRKDVLKYLNTSKGIIKNKPSLNENWVFITKEGSLIRNDFVEKELVDSTYSSTPSIGIKFLGLFNIEIKQLTNKTNSLSNYHNSYMDTRIVELWNILKLPPLIPFQIEELKEIVKSNPTLKYYLSKHLLEYEDTLPSGFKWWE